MVLNDLQKWLIADQICVPYDLKSIISTLRDVPRPSEVKLAIETIPQHGKFEPIPYSIAIIDFEGSPVVLAGILIQDTMLSYYIEVYSHIDQLHYIILEILLILRDLTLFSFSEFEPRAIHSIYTNLKASGYNVSRFNTIPSTSVINLQREKFESVAEAMFSTNVLYTGDPLFRNIKIINKLFLTHRLQDIIAHNCTCLLNESALLHRWVHYYHISGNYTMEVKKDA